MRERRAAPQVTWIGPVPPVPGGIAQHGARLVGALAAAGCTVRVLTWAAQYPARLYPGRRFDPDAVPLPGARALLRWWDPSSWWAAGRIASRGDLVVLPWVTPFHAPAQRLAMAAARCPVTVFVHNVRPHERMPGDERLARWVIGAADHTVTHAHDVASGIARLVPGASTTVVPHPPNLTGIDAAPLPPRPPIRLLCLGYVRPYKGTDLALDAVARLASRGVDVRLTVAGEFWEPVDAWERRVAASGLREIVDLRPGYVADDRVGELLAQHHLLVAPYRHATQSGVVPLAYAAGRPVVATAVGGLPDAVADGRTGVLVAPDDVDALAAGIERAIASLDALAAAAAACRWTWGAVADAVLAPIGGPPRSARG